ncbi:alpha/beta hydrolase [Nocardia tenerifensis]|uniref:alpha/beta hydrolase n=1 Tax=Nocardia tenerifensis TaxID=228006 RepID=UPI0012F62658|nr:alpha/beta fold hydrolase [Nocardia tenerifensis]
MAVPVSTGGNLIGQLCGPVTRTDTVLVLVAGSAANRSYWDFPYQRERYSFQLAMARAGFATLALDRPGNGLALGPISGATPGNQPPAATTATADAQGVHEVVQALRHGTTDHQYRRVVLAGNAVGSGVSVLEASTYHDVDGMLLTGYSHSIDPPVAIQALPDFRPAAAVEPFAGRGFGPGWFTLEFTSDYAKRWYFGPDVDPEVVDTAQATRDVFSIAEWPDGLTATLPGPTSRITVPVLITAGSEDRLGCGTVCQDSATLHAAEAPYFAPAAQLQTYVQPRAGNMSLLAPNADELHHVVIDWMNATVPE